MGGKAILQKGRAKEEYSAGGVGQGEKEGRMYKTAGDIVRMRAAVRSCAMRRQQHYYMPKLKLRPLASTLIENGFTQNE